MFERLESQLKGISGRTDEHVETNNVSTNTHDQRGILCEVDRTAESPVFSLGNG